MTLLEYVSIYLSFVKTEKKGIEAIFVCPNCQKKKLYVNLLNGKFHCFVCENRSNTRGGILSYLSLRFGAKKYPLDDFKCKVVDDENEESPLGLYLREQFQRIDFSNKMHFPAIRYLKERGLTDVEIFVYKFGTFANNPLWVGLDEGDVIWTRSVVNKEFRIANMKKNWIMFENRIDFKNTPVTLVEGVFDSMFVPNSIPLLGKNVNERLLKTLIDNDSETIIYLDKDAKRDAVSLFEKLSNYGIRAKIAFPEKKDPCDEGLEKNIENLEKAFVPDFHFIIQTKLELI